jgi:hypothetical protein
MRWAKFHILNDPWELLSDNTDVKKQLMGVLTSKSG